LFAVACLAIAASGAIRRPALARVVMVSFATAGALLAAVTAAGYLALPFTEDGAGGSGQAAIEPALLCVSCSIAAALVRRRGTGERWLPLGLVLLAAAMACGRAVEDCVAYPDCGYFAQHPPTIDPCFLAAGVAFLLLQLRVRSRAARGLEATRAVCDAEWRRLQADPAARGALLALEAAVDATGFGVDGGVCGPCRQCGRRPSPNTGGEEGPRVSLGGSGSFWNLGGAITTSGRVGRGWTSGGWGSLGSVLGLTANPVQANTLMGLGLVL
jgi:hypothetical protein